MAKLIFPGWATSPADWHAWKGFEIVDWGYFGPPSELPDQPAELIVAHSLGAHRIPKSCIGPDTRTVLISAFATYPYKRALAPFRDYLDIDSLHTFYELCGCNLPKRPHYDFDRLLADHTLLDTAKLSLTNLTCLHGTDDRVVPIRFAPKCTKLIPIDGASHFLPFTHPQECLDAIT